MLMVVVPPDFIIDPEANLPVRIDQDLLVPNALLDFTIDSCRPVTLDASQAIENADGDDPLYTFWYVNYADGIAGARVDDKFVLDYTFDPCTNPKVTGAGVYYIEFRVHDRQPTDLVDADGSRVLPEASDGFSDHFQWRVVLEDDTCCTE